MRCGFVPCGPAGRQSRRPSYGAARPAAVGKWSVRVGAAPRAAGGERGIDGDDDEFCEGEVEDETTDDGPLDADGEEEDAGDLGEKIARMFERIIEEDETKDADDTAGSTDGGDPPASVADGEEDEFLAKLRRRVKSGARRPRPSPRAPGGFKPRNSAPGRNGSDDPQGRVNNPRAPNRYPPKGGGRGRPDARRPPQQAPTKSDPPEGDPLEPPPTPITPLSPARSAESDADEEIDEVIEADVDEGFLAGYRESLREGGDPQATGAIWWDSGRGGAVAPGGLFAGSGTDAAEDAEEDADELAGPLRPAGRRSPRGLFSRAMSQVDDDTDAADAADAGGADEDGGTDGEARGDTDDEAVADELDDERDAEIEAELDEELDEDLDEELLEEPATDGEGLLQDGSRDTKPAPRDPGEDRVPAQGTSRLRVQRKRRLKREMIEKNSRFAPESAGRLAADDVEEVTQARPWDQHQHRTNQERRDDLAGKGQGSGMRGSPEDLIGKFFGSRRGADYSRRGRSRPELQDPPGRDDEEGDAEESGGGGSLRDQLANGDRQPRTGSFFRTKGAKLFKRQLRDKGGAEAGAGGAVTGSVEAAMAKVFDRQKKAASDTEERLIAERGIFMPTDEDFPDYDANDRFAGLPFDMEDPKLATDTCPTCKGDGLVTCPYCLGEEWLPPLSEYLSDPIGDAINHRHESEETRFIKRQPTPEMLRNLQEFWRRPNLAVTEDGWAQCGFCALGKSICPACEGSGVTTRKGFDYELEYRKAFPEECYEDEELDPSDEPYLAFSRYFKRRPSTVPHKARDPRFDNHP